MHSKTLLTAVILGVCSFYLAHGEDVPTVSAPVPAPALKGGEGAAAQCPPQIYLEELSDERTHEVATFPRVTTTLVFPSAIDKWTGSGFTSKPDKMQGDFAVEWTPGDNYLTLSPILEPTFRSTKLEEEVPRNLNIRCQGLLIVIDVVRAKNRGTAAGCVKFVEKLPAGYSKPGTVSPAATANSNEPSR